MHKGKHLLIDCCHVARELCLDDKRMLNVMARAAEQAGATVISQVRYRFGSESPPGFTAVVVLDESHCSAHTYADLGRAQVRIRTIDDPCMSRGEPLSGSFETRLGVSVEAPGPPTQQARSRE